MEIGKTVFDQKLGEGVVEKHDPANKRFEWFVRFKKGMRWMSEKDLKAMPEKKSEIEDALEG